jgi:hypothetical protein
VRLRFFCFPEIYESMDKLQSSFVKRLFIKGGFCSPFFQIKKPDANASGFFLYTLF